MVSKCWVPGPEPRAYSEHSSHSCCYPPWNKLSPTALLAPHVLTPAPQCHGFHTFPFMNKGPTSLQGQRLKHNGYSLVTCWSQHAMVPLPPTPSRGQRLPCAVREAEPGRIEQVNTRRAGIFGPGHIEGFCKRKQWEIPEFSSGFERWLVQPGDDK